MPSFVLTKSFWRENPLEPLSAAQIMYSSMLTMDMDEEKDRLYELLAPSLSEERREQLAAVQKELEQITTADEMVTFLRHSNDIVLEHTICKKALEMKEELAPLLLRRYRTSALDHFIESAALILYHAGPEYVARLKEMYHDIRNPYAQAQACLICGLSGGEDEVPFLMMEYGRFLRDYPDESYDQCPLLALYVLFGKYEPSL